MYHIFFILSSLNGHLGCFHVLLGFLGGSDGKKKKKKNLAEMLETQVPSLGWEGTWRREWQPTPVFLPGEFHGKRSLVGYSQT